MSWYLTIWLKGITWAGYENELDISDDFPNNYPKIEVKIVQRSFTCSNNFDTFKLTEDLTICGEGSLNSFDNFLTLLKTGKLKIRQLRSKVNFNSKSSFYVPTLAIEY